jgi:hypothetical protein
MYLPGAQQYTMPHAVEVAWQQRGADVISLKPMMNLRF